MTDEQRQHLERRLVEERERVVRSLTRYEERARTTEQEQDGDLSSYPFHPADQGTDAMQREVDASLATRGRRLLEEIDEALQRLYQEPERYGRCETSGEEIPFERLDLIPWARTCEDHAGGRA